MSPFKSQAQKIKFLQLVKEGKMSKATYEAWDAETGSTKLPERVVPKRRANKAIARAKRISR